VRRDASGKSDRLIRLTVLTIRLTILIDKVAHYLSEYKGIKRRLETMAEKKEKRAVEKGSDIKSSNKKNKKRKVSKQALRRVHGMLKSGASATKALIAERATDRERESCAEKILFKVTVRRKVYDVVMRKSNEDSGYWVESLSLPGCGSQGDTVQEALEMIKDAIKGHLAVATEKKKKRAIHVA
jgi:predicted RNase H-like HicB family nuclease